MSRFHYFAIFKPFGYLSQFTGEQNDKLLGDLYDFPKDVYSIGRLDKDSEGLLLLTNDNRYKTQILDPLNKSPKTYWVQVEGEITQEALETLNAGDIELNYKGKTHRTKPAIAEIISEPAIPERDPPIRYRKNIPTSWISLTIVEGKNRQVRKMTAAVGFPTLRLVRYQVDNFTIENMSPGDVVVVKP